LRRGEKRVCQFTEHQQILLFAAQSGHLPFALF
jgi:hypothetical protein